MAKSQGGTRPVGPRAGGGVIHAGGDAGVVFRLFGDELASRAARQPVHGDAAIPNGTGVAPRSPSFENGRNTALPVDLHAAAQPLALDPGLYLVRVGALDRLPHSCRGIVVPLVQVASDASKSRPPAEIVALTDDRMPWLGPEGGTLVIKAPAGGASIVFTTFSAEGHAPGTLDLDVERLDVAAAAEVAPAGEEPPEIVAENEALLHSELVADDAWFAEFIERSGLLDRAYYLKHNDDVDASGMTPGLHYLHRGEARGSKPNPYFQPRWYAKKYFDAPPTRGALRDYAAGGERQGRKPCPVFEPVWYAGAYGLDLNRQCALAHYLSRRRANAVSPNRYFDVAYYLEHNPGIADADIDAFEHWFGWGIFEDRKGSSIFDARFVRTRYLGDNKKANPFEIFMDVGGEFGWEPCPPESEQPVNTAYREVRKNCAPGPLFEELEPIPEGLERRRAKVVAFYLPQFHAIPENDAWWGAGFTEWQNIPRGMPRYVGHHQPRVPRDLGYYTLDTNDVMRRQIDLAQRMGVHGFCFYYYNFNGHRLLEKPVERFLQDETIDFPFCILWANENWTRRWDGAESELLIQQDYRPEDEPALIADLARHMKDPRYIRTPDGRPLLFVYRADIIPDCADAVASWRRQFRDDHGLDPVIVMTQTFGNSDPQPCGFDGALEFPPHNLTSGLELINGKLDVIDSDFSGYVYDYNDLVKASLAVPQRDFPLIKTAFPTWDNDARKQGASLSFANSTPQAFQNWVATLIDQARAKPFFGEPIVCVNAWNEWCEGAYLEPDVHHGYAYLNALGRAVAGEERSPKTLRVVLIGENAKAAPGPRRLLAIGRTLSRRFGIEVAFILIEPGELVDQYSAAAATYVIGGADETDKLRAQLLHLRHAGFAKALTNTLLPGDILATLAAEGLAVTALLDEVAQSPSEKARRGGECIREHCRAIVFQSEAAHGRFVKAFGAPRAECLVRAPEPARAGAASTAGSRTKDQPERRRGADRVAFADYCWELARILEPSLAQVSVVIPSYNYSGYLRERLSSVFDQTYPVYEIIIVDDASTDGSVSVIADLLKECGREVTVRINLANSGDVFHQWRGALDLARGEYLWIAEADDACSPEFLARLVPRVARSRRSLFGFTDAAAIGGRGEILDQTCQAYYADHGDEGLSRDGEFEARDFLRRFLAVRNLVLNASGVVWRTDALRRVFADLGDELTGFVCAGDWRVYIEACRGDGLVHYIADPLNHYRRHDRSVTGALNKQAHFDEICAIHELVRRDLKDDLLLWETSAYQEELISAWGLAVDDPPANGRGDGAAGARLADGSVRRPLPGVRGALPRTAGIVIVEPS